MSDYLVKACQGKIDRLQVALPPRHGKTTLVAHWLPLYYLAAYPDRKVIYATHSEGSAREHGEAARNLIQEFGPLLGLGLRRHAALDFQVVDLATGKPGGGMRSVGVCSGIHGKGANLAIIDDLYGNIQDAVSQSTRDSVWRWLTGSLFTRLADVSAVVGIGTPFHHDDHQGRFLAAEEAGGDKWTRIRLPALAGPDDPLGRPEGAALWPSMFPQERLIRIRDNLIAAGQYRDWAAQYELRPVFGDGISDWEESYFEGILADEVPPGQSPIRVLALDPSKGRDSQRGDYSAWIDATLVNRCVYCWSDLRRVPIERLEDVTVGMMQVNRYHAVIIEGNGFQEMIAHNVVRKARERGIHTPVFIHVNTLPKLVRIRAGVGPLLAQKFLKLVPSPGRTLLLGQLKSFPNDHDDGPDAIELAQQILHQLISKTPPHGQGGFTLVQVR